MNFVQRAWKGKEKLWKVFWSGILIPQILGFIAGLFIAAYITGSGADKTAAHEAVKADLTSLPWVCMLSVYYLVLSVCVWRCAFNVRQRFWGIVARVVTILFTVVMVLTIPKALGRMHAVSPMQSNNGSEQ